MRSKEIQRLVKIVEESNIAELEFRRWGQQVRISKFPSNGDAPGNAVHYAIPAAPPAPAVPPAPAPAAAPSEPAEPAPSTSGDELKSPMVGTFYRSPAPDADPYVKVGDTVQEGQVLCIIEAMKLMNEVEAEFSCRILEIKLENGQPVEYNQPLFIVEKL